VLAFGLLSDHAPAASGCRSDTLRASVTPSLRPHPRAQCSHPHGLPVPTRSDSAPLRKLGAGFVRGSQTKLKCPTVWRSSTLGDTTTPGALSVDRSFESSPRSSFFSSTLVVPFRFFSGPGGGCCLCRRGRDQNVGICEKTRPTSPFRARSDDGTPSGCHVTGDGLGCSGGFFFWKAHSFRIKHIRLHAKAPLTRDRRSQTARG
jgi:hypothetical protein